MTATPSTASTRSHLKGEHSRWCQKIKGKLIYCRFTDYADREGEQMMAVLELYGKCKQLGYCDCGGFWGCHDPNPPAPKPVIENELQNAMKAELQTTVYTNHNYRRELEAIERS